MAVRIDESHNSPNFTAAADCPATFANYSRMLSGDTVHHWDAKYSATAWAGTMATLTNDYRNPGRRGVSAHLMVEPGSAACMVSPVLLLLGT